MLVREWPHPVSTFLYRPCPWVHAHTPHTSPQHSTQSVPSWDGGQRQGSLPTVTQRVGAELRFERRQPGSQVTGFHCSAPKHLTKQGVVSSAICPLLSAIAVITLAVVGYPGIIVGLAEVVFLDKL